MWIASHVFFKIFDHNLQTVILQSMSRLLPLTQRRLEFTSYSVLAVKWKKKCSKLPSCSTANYRCFYVLFQKTNCSFNSHNTKFWQKYFKFRLNFSKAGTKKVSILWRCPLIKTPPENKYSTQIKRKVSVC